MIANLQQLAMYVGAQTFHLFTYVYASLHLSWLSGLALLQLRWLSRPAVRHVVIRQLYFTGVQGLTWVVLMALVAGSLAVYSIVEFARQVQDLSLIGNLIGGVLLQEVAPMVIAFFLLVRSGVAVVTEVGNIQTRGEPMVLASLGMSEHEYLLMPRLLGFALSGLILTVVFVLIALWFGGVVVSMSNTLNFSEFMFEVRGGVDLLDMAIMVGKSLLYPILIVLVLISQGHKVGDDPNQIPVRATYGMLGALSLIALTDALLAVLQIVLW